MWCFDVFMSFSPPFKSHSSIRRATRQIMILCLFYHRDSEDDVENVVRLPKPNRHRQFSTSTVSSTSSKLLLPLWAVWLSFREAWWGFSQLWPDTIREAVAFLFGWWILRPPSYSSRFAFWREIVV